MALDINKLNASLDAYAEPYGPEAQLRQSLIEAQDANPDKAAQAIPLARSNKIPLDMAERNMEYLQRQANFNKTVSTLQRKQSPDFLQWLRDKDNARIAYDDIDTLTKISDLTVRAPIGGVISGTGSAIGAVGTVLEGEEALYGHAGYAAQVGKFLRQNVAKPIKEFGSGLVPEERRTYGTEVTGVVGQMVPLIVAGVMTGSPAVAAAVGAGQNADQMADQAELEGATARQKFFSSLGAGAVTALTEYAPIGIIMGKFPWMKKMLEKAPEALQSTWAQKALDIGAAGSAEAAQEFVENIFNNTIEHFVFNPDQKIMEDVAHQASLGGSAGAVSRAIIMAIGGNLRSEKSVNDQKKAMAEARIAAESKLRARSPEKFKQAIEAIRGDANYYIPVEKGVEFYQSMSDSDADKLQKDFPELKRKIADAVNTGSDIMMSQAEYLAYLAPLDTKQILSGVLKAHQEMDVLETFPDLKAVLPKEGDTVGDELQARLEKEARAAGRTRGEAELYATASRAAYDVLNERNTSQNAEFSRLIEQRLGSGLSVGQKRDTKIERGDIDRLLNLLRNSIKKNAELPATRKKGDKEVYIRRRGPRAPTPIINYLAGRGVALGSDLAKELESMGVTPKTHKKLFKRGDSGPNLFGMSAPGGGRKVGFDAIPASEINDYLQSVGLIAPDEGTGYVDPQWIMDQVRAEVEGQGAADTETAAEDARLEDLIQFMDYLGLDLNSSNAEIKKAINDYNEGKQVEIGGKTFFQNEKPVKDPTAYLADKGLGKVIVGGEVNEYDPMLDLYHVAGTDARASMFDKIAAQKNERDTSWHKENIAVKVDGKKLVVNAGKMARKVSQRINSLSKLVECLS